MDFVSSSSSSDIDVTIFKKEFVQRFHSMLVKFINREILRILLKAKKKWVEEKNRKVESGVAPQFVHTRFF